MLAVECESILLIILAVAVANIIQELEVPVENQYTLNYFFQELLLMFMFISELIKQKFFNPVEVDVPIFSGTSSSIYGISYFIFTVIFYWYWNRFFL